MQTPPRTVNDSVTLTYEDARAITRHLAALELLRAEEQDRYTRQFGGTSEITSRLQREINELRHRVSDALQAADRA